jgi:glycosyltransferase involved in cell wall biosynthesis
MNTLRVIVPTYKRPQDIESLLAHLRPQIEGQPDRKLTVVNDGAHDDSYAAVVRPHLSWMTYIPAPTNGGPAAARNLGARDVQEDFIVFTDDDCRPPAIWLDYLQGRYEAEPWLDGVAGYTRPVFGNPDSLRERIIAASRLLPGATHDEVGRLTCAVTAAFSIRTRIFHEIGGFDETFRPSGEDLDLTQRLLRAGAILEADQNWWTGHTTTDTLKSYVRRYFTYGEGSARYAYTRQDWIHPDLRNYLTEGARARAVGGWIEAVKTNPTATGLRFYERWALKLFVAAIARAYARGFASGVVRFQRDDALPPVDEPWRFWPRLGLADEDAGLPRR